MNLLWFLSRIIGIVILMDIYLNKRIMSDIQLFMFLLFIVEAMITKIEKGVKK